MAETAIVNVAWSDHDITDVHLHVGTAMDAANTMVITPTGPLEEMVILIRNTEADANVVTVKAGVGPSAVIGDLVCTELEQTIGVGLLPPLESARFLQADGTVHITVEAGMTGAIAALQRPAVNAGSILVAGT